MTPTDYTRLLSDYAQACDLIAAQKRQIDELSAERCRLRMAVMLEVDADDFRYRNELAQALRELADAEKRAGNEKIDHEHTADICLAMQREMAAQKRQIEALRGALEPFAQWDIDRIPYGCGFAKHYKVARDAIALQPASEPKPTPLLGEIHEIQRIEDILKGGSTPPASGSTPDTPSSDRMMRDLELTMFFCSEEQKDKMRKAIGSPPSTPTDTTPYDGC